ncbi:MAG TPA: type I glutamate--ammonia ligase [Clostridia bacterium]|jgi:glutamine synthetase|nr:type I glutamate--ammonia ligase [Clostridia bacterium]HPY44058.1 type I glutamate--ammonia ligase [Clostridia bacterium]HQO56769.1 type I glutamate--ammonia ligase [Clostridia bacterium]HUM60712.1 type I glutamate--ammonia ligase [Clostridia bacterium]
MTHEEVTSFIRDQGIRFIRLQFTDIFGQLKNIAITASQMERALANQVTIDGSSIEGFLRLEESDMMLYPDLSTFALLPWHQADDRVARLICDVHTPDGKPFPGDPRYILRQVIAQAHEMGYTFNVGPECEFFLFHTDANGHPTTHTNDEAGYFDLGPIDRGEIARRDICLALEDMGFQIEASHHESAPGQHEIDFKYADALRTADNIMTFKLAVKTIAQQHGLHATFMPKPIYGTSGSGMHTNMSLFKHSDNLFYDPKGEKELSREAYSFIAGLLRHISGITAVCNPLVNSYKRLVSGFEAPFYKSWSARNRSVLIRIPSARKRGTRLELRSPDPSCNPYLALALCLAAGLEGIREGLTPPPEIAENIYTMTEDQRKARGIEPLPCTLYEAVQAMKQDSLIANTLGSHIMNHYTRGKLREWEDYRIQVSQWELDKYLVLY